MRTTLLLLLVIACLFIGRFTPLYECSAASFTYDKINAVILVSEDNLPDKIIHETNNYNVDYEQAIICIHPDKTALLVDLLDTLSRYTIDYTIDDKRFRKSAKQLEICLENFEIEIDKERASLFKNYVDVIMQADMYLHHGDQTEELSFQTEAHMTTTGLTTNFFIEQVLLELYLEQLHESVGSYLEGKLHSG